MNNILVTGASGVIGIPLVRHLLQKFPNSIINATYHTSSEQLLKFKSDRCIIISYLDEISNSNKYDQIWHFATYGQPARFIEDWRSVVKLNTDDILQLTKKLKPSGKFYYSSTSELYGDSINATETTKPSTYPGTLRSVYTDSKRLGESILSLTLPSELYRVFRICLAYSSDYRIGDKRVLYELVMKALIHKSINLIDDGSALRQYIYIDDAINMMSIIADQSLKVFGLSEKDTPVFNISNNEPLSILELANIIGKYYNVPVIPGLKKNHLEALPTIRVIPKRFLDFCPDYSFTPIKDAIPIICKNAKQKYNIHYT